MLASSVSLNVLEELTTPFKSDFPQTAEAPGSNLIWHPGNDVCVITSDGGKRVIILRIIERNKGEREE